MRALLMGFFGRLNSGDELMLRQHQRILGHLGFGQIDLFTENPQHASGNCPYRMAYRPLSYQLVLIGGGALNIGFGLHIATREKLQGRAKVVMSSVNIPLGFDERYQTLLRLLVDRIITRAPDEYEAFRDKLPIRFLPDVATTYRPRSDAALRDRIAVVLRQHNEVACRFAPEEAFDILVLSERDGEVARRYAATFGGTLIDVHQKRPEEHVDLVSRYRRVVSIGRYHAALYAATAGRDYIYIFPTYYPSMIEKVRHVAGRLSWARLQEMGRLHCHRSKAGVLSTELAGYGRASEAQYAECFAEVLKAAESGISQVTLDKTRTMPAEHRR